MTKSEFRSQESEVRIKPALRQHDLVASASSAYESAKNTSPDNLSNPLRGKDAPYDLY
jgi:hypothetical protein